MSVRWNSRAMALNWRLCGERCGERRPLPRGNGSSFPILPHLPRERKGLFLGRGGRLDKGGRSTLQVCADSGTQLGRRAKCKKSKSVGHSCSLGQSVSVCVRVLAAVSKCVCVCVWGCECVCVHTKTLSSGYFQDNEGVCEIDSLF